MATPKSNGLSNLSRNLPKRYKSAEFVHAFDEYFDSIKDKPTLESDPHGKAPNESGAKLDAGKIRPALVLGGFAKALTEVTKVGTYGATKYTDNGWKDVPEGVSRYNEAFMRHWLKYQSGELNDPDTNLSHLAHCAWNALAILELTMKEEK